MSTASNTYRGYVVVSSADLLGQALLTVYRPDGAALGQYGTQQQARRGGRVVLGQVPVQVRGRGGRQVAAQAQAQQDAAVGVGRRRGAIVGQPGPDGGGAGGRGGCGARG